MNNISKYVLSYVTLIVISIFVIYVIASWAHFMPFEDSYLYFNRLNNVVNKSLSPDSYAGYYSFTPYYVALTSSYFSPSSQFIIYQLYILYVVTITAFVLHSILNDLQIMNKTIIVFLFFALLSQLFSQGFYSITHAVWLNAMFVFIFALRYIFFAKSNFLYLFSFIFFIFSTPITILIVIPAFIHSVANKSINSRNIFIIASAVTSYIAMKDFDTHRVLDISLLSNFFEHLHFYENLFFFIFSIIGCAYIFVAFYKKEGLLTQNQILLSILLIAVGFVFIFFSSGGSKGAGNNNVDTMFQLYTRYFSPIFLASFLFAIITCNRSKVRYLIFITLIFVSAILIKKNEGVLSGYKMTMRGMDKFRAMDNFQNSCQSNDTFIIAGRVDFEAISIKCKSPDPI